MALPVYTTGTVSVAAGGTIVTGVGTLWSGTNVKQGDFISINNLQTVLVTEVTDTTHIVIPPWTGAVQTGVAYKIYQNYVGRVVGVAAAEDVGVMIEKLHTDGLPFIVDPAETVPDPSFGNNGQLAFKPSTGEWWTKTAGVWVPSPGFTGSDPTRVADTGDTMTGDLIITKPTPLFVANKPTSTSNAGLSIQTNLLQRWIVGASSTAEAAGDVGSDLFFGRYNNAGGFIGSAVTIKRSNGDASIASTTASTSVATGALTVGGGIGVGGDVTSVVGRFRSDAKNHLFGTATGALATAAMPQTDANILLYNLSSTNWAGMGVDTSGNMWFKVGTTGTPTPALYFQGSDKLAVFTGTAVTLAPSSGPGPTLNFNLAGVRQSFITDNGSTFNFLSNTAGSAGMYINHGASLWSAVSDARLPWKKTATPLTVLDKINAVQLYEGNSGARDEIFVKAQEFHSAFPQLVKVGSGPDDYEPTGMSDPAAWGMSYDRVGVIALQGLKEAMQVIEQLQARIAALEAAAQDG